MCAVPTELAHITPTCNDSSISTYINITVKSKELWRTSVLTLKKYTNLLLSQGIPSGFGKMLEQVEVFKYMGRLLAFDDTDVQAMRGNLSKAWKCWARISRVFTHIINIRTQCKNNNCNVYFAFCMAQEFLPLSQSCQEKPVADQLECMTFHLSFFSLAV